MKSKLKHYFFPNGLRWTWAMGSFVLSVLILYNALSYGLVLFLALSSLVLFSTYSEIIVDTHKNVIVDSFRILWLPFHYKKFPFREIHNIRLDKERDGQTTNSAMGGRSGQIDFNVYTASIEYNNDRSIVILSRVDWHPFREEVGRIGDELGIEIYRTF